MSETIHFEENEYRALEAIAKKTGFKTVDDLVSAALINFCAHMQSIEISPEENKQLLEKWREAIEENPDLDLIEFVKNFYGTPPEIETEEITVKIPKKLLKLVQVLRNQDWEEYLSKCLTDTVAADIEAEAFGDHREVIKDFGLTEEFQFYQGH